jgi:hypothetical protein
MFSDIDAKASGKVSEGVICQINQFTVRKIKINILKVKDGCMEASCALIFHFNIQNVHLL